VEAEKGNPGLEINFGLSEVDACHKDSPLFVAATGGLDVDAIPNQISTRIILNSSKSSILAQAINIGAKGVK